MKEPNKTINIGSEQEMGAIPLNAEVKSPVVLAQPYEGGSEKAMESPDQYNDEEVYETADEEEEETPRSESAETQETP